MCCSRRGMPRASIVCAINDIEGRSYVILVNGWMLSVSVAAAHAACSSKPLNDSNVVERGAVGPRFGGAAQSCLAHNFNTYHWCLASPPTCRQGNDTRRTEIRLEE